MDDVSTRSCNRCGSEKPLTSDYFPFHKGKPEGEICKECRRVYKQTYYQANREKILDDRREYREANPEIISERKRVYHEANKEKTSERRRETYRIIKENLDPQSLPESKICRVCGRNLAASEFMVNVRTKDHLSNRCRACASDAFKRYYANNQDYCKQRALEYARANPEKVLERNRTRRARQRNAEGSHTAQDVRNQHETQRGHCWWCRKKLEVRFHIDHVIPLSRGGSDRPENIVITCPTCNQKKYNKLPHEFMGRLF